MPARAPTRKSLRAQRDRLVDQVKLAPWNCDVWDWADRVATQSGRDPSALERTRARHLFDWFAQEQGLAGMSLADCHQEVFAGRFNTALPPPNALTICGRLGNVALGALSYQASAFGHCGPAPAGAG